MSTISKYGPSKRQSVRSATARPFKVICSPSQHTSHPLCICVLVSWEVPLPLPPSTSTEIQGKRNSYFIDQNIFIYFSHFLVPKTKQYNNITQYSLQHRTHTQTLVPVHTCTLLDAIARSPDGQHSGSLCCAGMSAFMIRLLSLYVNNLFIFNLSRFQLNNCKILG